MEEKEEIIATPQVEEITSITKTPFFRFYEKYMLFMGIAGQLMFYMQAIQIYTSRSAQGVSLSGFGIGLLCVFSWMVYGLLIRNHVLVLSNLIATIGAFLVVLGAILYG